MENIPRIRSLLAANHRAGAQCLQNIEDVDRAARRAYSPKGYDVADYELAFLMYKIGGRATANIAHRALESLNRHCKTSCFDVTNHSVARLPNISELQAISQPVTHWKRMVFHILLILVSRE